MYVTFELANTGSDTVWVPMYGLAYGNLRATLTRDDASVVPHLGLHADFWPVAGWRGVPVPPGAALYETAVLQDGWGYSGPSAPNLYIAHLPVGRYQLRAQFNTQAQTGPNREGRLVLAEPVEVGVRPRAQGEEVEYQQVKQIRDMAWDRDRRQQYLRALVSWVEGKVRTDSTDPFLAFLLAEGIATANAVGQGPGRLERNQLVALRLDVARVQRSLPAGAHAIQSGYGMDPDLMPHRSPELMNSLAGAAATMFEGRRRTPSPP